ncbi:hypothetical protein QNN03_36640 [Streptomyces sp. GXMU-J15]|uniref:ATP-binding protein n=1 Tax=Streptomyces fuscus TaxID=3048495 RepID=A0ABT7JAR8_9ACTN|nr:hypothetical protein [Streptomyces fuscus]MDL2081968.1 hypothetical protein [Streptomyces fuscus]
MDSTKEPEITPEVQDLKRLVEQGLSTDVLETCSALGNLTVKSAGIRGAIRPDGRSKMLEEVLRVVIGEQRKQALEMLDDVLPKDIDRRHLPILVAAAGELLGLHDVDAFNTVLQVRRPLIEGARDKSLDAVWSDLLAKDNKTGVTVERRLRAALWLGRTSSKTTEFGPKRRQKQLLEALASVVKDYLETPRVRSGLRGMTVDHVALNQAKHQELPAGLWPFKIIEPKSSVSEDWKNILDGSTLTPTFCSLGHSVERRIEHGGAELDTQGALAWLSNQCGRTVFFYGDRGDGRSSYINHLAAHSLDAHIFLWWKSTMLGFDVRALEQYRENVIGRLEEGAPGSEPTIVVVCELQPPGRPDIEEHLIMALHERQHDDDGLVILIAGREGQLNHLATRVARREEMQLKPVSDDEAEKLAILLREASQNLKPQSEQEVTKRYPNLRRFLQLDEVRQIKLLADPEHPLLVCLLKAVYGTDMWSKLYEELEDLSPADRKAYMHICLASLAGMSLPDSILIRLAPGVALDERSQRDPWIRNDEDENSARHQYIAQVVLEKSCASRGKRPALLAECVRDYGKNFRSGREFGDVLRQLILTAKGFEPVSTSRDADELKRAIRDGAREALLGVEDLYGTIHSQDPENYWHHTEWAKAIWSFVQGVQARELTANHLALLDVCDKLLKTARDLPGCVDPQRLDYYLARHRVLRLRSEETPNFDALCEAIQEASAFSGSEWFKKNYYLDLFAWSRELLSFVGANPIEEPDVENARDLYEVMTDSHETLRAKFPEIGSKELGGTKKDTSFGDLVTRIAFEQFPREVATGILKEAWERSVELGNPNEQTGTAYAEGLLKQREKERGLDREEELRKEAVEILAIIATSESPTPHGASLLARHAREDEIPPGWASQLDEAVKRKDLSHHARAHLNHARALIEQDETKRIRFLQYAVSFYRQAAWPNGDPKRTVQRDWWDAIQDLEKTDFSDWGKYKKQHLDFYNGKGR